MLSKTKSRSPKKKKLEVKIEKDTNAMEDLLKKQINFLPLKRGDTVEGMVINKTRNKIWIEIEGRGIGMVPSREMPIDLEEIKVGEKVIAFVLEPEDEDGNIILSLRKADREKIWLSLKRKYEQQDNLAIRITEANRGGLMTEVSGVKGFLPLSQLSSDHYPQVGGDKNKILDKLSKLVGLRLEVKIIGLDQSTNKLIFSEKKIAAKINEEKIKELKIGQKVTGTISGAVDFGLFVRFKISEDSSQEYEGLVHISEIAWGKVRDIKKEYKVNDKVEAEIISVDDNRVSLSIKKLLPDPWQKKVKKYKVGLKIKGEVARVTPFGAFIELEKDVEGLVHISEIGDGKIADPREVLKEGDKKEFEVISVEPDAHKIGLSLKKIKVKK